MSLPWVRLVVATAAPLLPASPALAAVTSYVAPGLFDAASNQTAFTSFENDVAGYQANPFVSSGIRFTQLPGGHPNVIPYIAPAGGAGTVPEALSQVLEGNGEENFRIELANGASFNAIGFALYTNAYAAPVLSLFAPGGTLIGNYTVPQAPHQIGFFGLTSTAAIGSVVLIVDRGWIENVAIDNVSIGSLAGGIPEPANWALLVAGFGLLGGARRRRRTFPVVVA
jgi:hypothetical protein